MEKDIQNTAIGSWGKNSELEKSVAVGVHGTPELKPDEKALYLGEFKERVLLALTKEQLKERAIYVEVIQALQDDRAVRMIFNGDVDSGYADKYYQLARKYGKPYVIRHDQKYKSQIGLMVVGSDAVGITTVAVPDREERLKKLGLPIAVIQAAGSKLCSDCYELVERVAPAELVNYQQLSFWDRITGEKCPTH